jgi:hypothetical protein
MPGEGRSMLIPGYSRPASHASEMQGKQCKLVKHTRVRIVDRMANQFIDADVVPASQNCIVQEEVHWDELAIVVLHPTVRPEVNAAYPLRNTIESSSYCDIQRVQPRRA